MSSENSHDERSAAKEHDLFKTYVRALEADLNKAGDEIHRLREALSFYSADKNWRTHRTPTGEAPSDAEVDRGKVARDALA